MTPARPPQSRQRTSSSSFPPLPARMEAVNIPADSVPEGWKACEQILRRAKELKKTEPVVSYWCSFSAAQTALKFPNRTAKETEFLMSLLDALEQMKDILHTNEAVTNDAAGSAYIENFALKVFMGADNDDRAGNCGKNTIRKFVVAGQFIEVLGCFDGGIREDMKEKYNYAKWKAADLAKALREGRTPVPGPPLQETEDFPPIPSSSPSQGNSSDRQLPSPPTHRGSFSSITRPSVPPPLISPRPSPLQKQNLSQLPGSNSSSQDNLRTPVRSHSQGSGVWSTVATPGLPDDEDGEKRFDLKTRRPSVTVTPSPPIGPLGESPEKKNVRFMGPDGAPLSPAQTILTVDSYDTPDAPPPTLLGTDSPPKINPVKVRRESNSSSSRPIPPNPARSTMPPPPPPPSLASYPTQPPVHPQPNGLGLTSPAPAPPTRKQMEQSQKHARFAISALDYDDIETARSELRKAMALLG